MEIHVTQLIVRVLPSFTLGVPHQNHTALGVDYTSKITGMISGLREVCLVR
jgi:hypothetical protein